MYRKNESLRRIESNSRALSKHFGWRRMYYPKEFDGLNGSGKGIQQSAMSKTRNAIS